MQECERVSLTTIELYFTNWSKTFLNREISTVFFLPHADLLFRVKQFQQWLDQTHQLSTVTIDLEVELIADPQQLATQLETHAQKPIILVTKRSFVGPNGVQWQAVIEHFRHAEHHGLIVFHEATPTELQPLNRFSSFSVGQTVFPLYAPEQVLGFCATLAKDWQLPLNAQDFVIVAEYCGGLLWFVKEIFRQIRDGKISTVEEGFTTESFIWKTEQFWNDLPLTYRTALLNPATATKTTLDELYAFRLFVSNPEDQIQIWPFLQPNITNSHHQAITCTIQTVRYFDQELTSFFSLAERRVLAALWAVRGQIVSRESIGESFWQTEVDEKYSDWALDQMMRRLKAKVQKAGLPVTISTKRGQGYMANA